MTLVSAIMPTRGRQSLARKAVECFIRQDYPNRELVIIDDLNDRSFPNGTLDLPHSSVPIIYTLDASRSIAEKRNLCCGLAKGGVVWTLDSDDWSSPERMADQVQRLEESGKAVTGYHSLLFHVEHSHWMKYEGQPNYALGTSLCFLKSFWQQNPFRPGTWPEFPNVGEDHNFVAAAARMGELASVDGGLMMVARAHEGQTNPTLRQMNDPAQQCYRPVEAPVLEGYEP